MIRIMILMNQPAAQFVFDIQMSTTPSRKRKWYPTEKGWNSCSHPPRWVGPSIILQPWLTAVVISVFGRWCCPKTLNTQYIYTCIYIYLHIYIFICTYTTSSQTHKHSKWFLLFFPLKQNHKNTPTFLQNPTRGCIPKAKDWHLKPIPERKLLVPEVRRSCTDDAQLASLTLTPWLDLYSGSRWYGVLRATAEETERCPVCWVKWPQHAPRLLHVSTRRRTEFMHVEHLLKHLGTPSHPSVWYSSWAKYIEH